VIKIQMIYAKHMPVKAETKTATPTDPTFDARE
jgi:hypothetical protein